MLGMRYPMEVNLSATARETLRALLPLLERKPDRAWRERDRGQRRALVARSSRTAAMPTPSRSTRSGCFWELDQLLPDRAIVTGDSGSGTAGTRATCGCAAG